MARLFIRHKPVDCTVTSGFTPGRFTVLKQVLVDAGIDLDPYSYDLVYVCIAHNRDIWAARSFWIHADSALVQVRAVVLEDQPCVQEMLLADMILN